MYFLLWRNLIVSTNDVGVCCSFSCVCGESARERERKGGGGPASPVDLTFGAITKRVYHVLCDLWLLRCVGLGFAA